MSRREEEFKHRTSIFEGSYRAWSHLGGMEPDVVFDTTKSVSDFDPLQFPLRHDSRIKKSSNSSSKSSSKSNSKVSSSNTEDTGIIIATTSNTTSSNTASGGATNDDGSIRPEYPYEPLPRSGLAHPYVQAILSPWLGPQADQDAIELGLGTLRTWWQHRRKGENKSALRILGTAKMQIIVDKYTKHFFDLAFCLVTNDLVQAPRTLQLKLKQSDKLKHRFMSQRSSMDENDGDDDDQNHQINEEDYMSTSMTSSSTRPKPEELAHLTPLERMHLIQQNALNRETSADFSETTGSQTNLPVIRIKGKCIPGKIDLPGIVDAVKRRSNNLAHRGSSSGGIVNDDGGDGGNDSESAAQQQEYGDPTTIPLLFVSSRNEYIIVLKVDGITCAHCVKIVETVLKGCSGANTLNGNKSPINGLLDAAADHGVSSVIILIDHPQNAKRIAYESKRNLSLVGYVAKAITVPLVSPSSQTAVETNNDPTLQQRERQMQRDMLQRSMLDYAKAFPIDFFDFQEPCTCPDSGVYRSNCPRHSQMDDSMFDSLSDYERRVYEFVKSKRSGAKNLLSMDSDHHNRHSIAHSMTTTSVSQQQQQQQLTHDNVGGYNNDVVTDHALHIDQPMQFLSSEDESPEAVMIMNDPLSTIDVDPLPFYNQNQLRYTPQQHHQPAVSKYGPMTSHVPMNQPARYPMHHQTNTAITTTTANNSNLRGNNNSSALSIDWEVYELFNEFVATGDSEAVLMGDLLPDYDQHHTVHQHSTLALPGHDSNHNHNSNNHHNYHPPLAQQEQPEQEYLMDGHDDVFRV